VKHTVETVEVPSRALHRTLPCTLLLPGGRPPQAVAYLLHGGYSHHAEWAERVDLAGLAARWPLALALPEGAFSLWVHGHDGQRWGRYAAFDVPDAVERRLGLRLPRAKRAVAGLSMGGFGALHLGLTYPERYVALASLSGAFGMTWWNIGRVEGSPFLPALGPVGSGTRTWVEPTATLARALKRVRPPGLPAMWLATGTEDDPEVTEALRALHRTLLDAQVAHTAVEVPGGHTWDFWRQQTPALLAFLAGALQLEAGAGTAGATTARPGLR
jgi:putative tributyrin esterase